MWSESHERWLLFAGDVLISANEINRELQMSAQIKGLAETVRRAKSVLGVAGQAAQRLEGAAAGLAETVATVDAMTGEIVAADTELRGVVDAMKEDNGPLPASTEPSLGTAVGAPLTLGQSVNIVHEANKQ
jgi:ABC-type transporter Mla subunit MlaD